MSSVLPPLQPSANSARHGTTTHANAAGVRAEQTPSLSATSCHQLKLLIALTTARRTGNVRQPYVANSPVSTLLQHSGQSGFPFALLSVCQYHRREHCSHIAETTGDRLCSNSGSFTAPGRLLSRKQCTLHLVLHVASPAAHGCTGGSVQVDRARHRVWVATSSAYLQSMASSSARRWALAWLAR